LDQVSDRFKDLHILDDFYPNHAKKESNYPIFNLFLILNFIEVDNVEDHTKSEKIKPVPEVFQVFTFLDQSLQEFINDKAACNSSDYYF
jgi:hypothetical protein